MVRWRIPFAKHYKTFGRSEERELKRNIHQIYVLRVANETGIGATCAAAAATDDADAQSPPTNERHVSIAWQEHNEILNQCRLFYLLPFSGACYCCMFIVQCSIAYEFFLFPADKHSIRFSLEWFFFRVSLVVCTAVCSRFDGFKSLKEFATYVRSFGNID